MSCRITPACKAPSETRLPLCQREKPWLTELMEVYMDPASYLLHVIGCACWLKESKRKIHCTRLARDSWKNAMHDQGSCQTFFSLYSPGPLIIKSQPMCLWIINQASIVMRIVYGEQRAWTWEIYFNAQNQTDPTQKVHPCSWQEVLIGASK